MGYRQTVAESLAEGDGAAIDTHAGETARGVYEVACKVRGDDDLSSREAGMPPARLTD